MTQNFTKNIFGIHKKYWQKNQGQGAHTLSTRVGGAPTPLGAPPASWAPWCSTDLNSNSIYSRSGRKKSERRIHRVLRYGTAAASCSSSGGQIWSPFGALERGNRRHHHHQPSSITNFMMLTAVRETFNRRL